MTAYSFLTIHSATEATYKEKGSKFLAFAYPVSSEAEVRERLDTLKKKYFDASHHCYAYILGVDKHRSRAFDDGEPSHSAGDPILGQLRARGITNALVVVVRYFGGTKLGVGGLVAAYKLSADEALRKATLVTVDITRRIVIDYPYASTPDVMKLIKDFDIRILGQTFEQDCRIVGDVKFSNMDRFRTRVDLMVAMKLPLKVTEEE